jgi:hypothetical protein
MDDLLRPESIGVLSGFPEIAADYKLYEECVS